MITVTIEASKTYDILIGRGLLDACGEKLGAVLPKVQKVMLVGDDTTMELYGDRAQASLSAAGYTVTRFVFPHGEENKNLAIFAGLLEAMASAGLTRTDCAVALGGGVVGDLTGFAAA
ncbi:MAG: iron-containing alcohol dehydrogenase, partial [Clostridia bacterium]|nr:iron-containing alcohol dehydrogenase [Clostridia bacterium]